MDDTVSETTDRENPYFIVAPAFPNGITLAGIIWIIIGALILLLLAWWESVLILALLTSDRGMSQEDWIVINFLMAVVLGSFAFGFIFVGIRTTAGIARDTLASGSGSTLFGCIYLTTAVAVAVTAPLDKGSVLLELGACSSVGAALFAAGILALAGRNAYREWRKATKANIDCDREGFAAAEVARRENDGARPTAPTDAIHKPDQPDDRIH
jgi:hypothetical protein